MEKRLKKKKEKISYRSALATVAMTLLSGNTHEGHRHKKEELVAMFV